MVSPTEESSPEGPLSSRLNPLLPGEDSAKRAIASTVAHAIAGGATLEQLRTMRAELAEAHRMTIGQVAAVTAWVRIRADKIRMGVNRESEATTDQVITLCTRMEDLLRHGDERALVTAAEQARLPTELARSLWAKATDLFATPQMNVEPRLPAVNSSTSTNSQPVAPAELRTRTLPARSSGADTDYDSPIKIRWRNTWIDFLARHLSGIDVSKAELICLPSKRPAREVQHYLKLGFRPENIHAVEREPAAFEEFRAGCSALGIRAHCGELQDIVSTMPNKFSVVSYDFVSPVGIAVYQLGPFGTAAKELKAWDLAPGGMDGR